MRRFLPVAILLVLFAISVLAEKQEPQVFRDKLEIYGASRKFQIELLIAPPQDFDPPFIDQTGKRILSPTAILMQVGEYRYVEQEQSVQCGHGRVFSATPTNSVGLDITERDLFELKKLIDNAVAKLQRISEESKPSR